MESWRIKTNLRDMTERASTSSQIIGATVIKAPKGPKEFYFFSKGETQKVLNTFGYPSKDYPAIQDALDVVSKSDMWIARPYKSDGKFGGVFITESGTYSFTNGFSSKEIDDYANIECEVVLAEGDSVTKTFEFTLPNHSKYKYNSIGIKIGEEVATVESTDENVEVLTSDILTSGTYNREEGTLNLEFTTAPSSIIYITYKTDMSDTLVTLFAHDMQLDDLSVKVVKNKYVDDILDVHVSRYNPISEEDEELSNSPFIIGLSETSRDSEGNNVYVENVFGEKQLLFTPIINKSTFTTFANDTKFVKLSGGNSGSAVEDTNLTSIYTTLQDTEKYSVKFVFDSNASKSIVDVFYNLRNSYQKRCRFMYCSPNVDAETIRQDQDGVYDYGVKDNRGLWEFVLTWGIHTDIYQGNDFLCSNMGLIAGKIVDMLNNGWGEPMWLNGDNNVGGQLGPSITKLSHGADQSQLQALAELFLNPVIKSKTYGVMIENASTRQTKLSVLSDIGISSLVDTILELIEKNVLPPRIGKLIDSTSYANVRSGCNSILQAYSPALEDYFVLCDETNNTAEMRDQETLVVTVAIVPKKYAKKIILNLTLHKSGVDVKEAVTNV